MTPCTKLDKGVYKLVARNEKGEATSQTVEVVEIPDDDDKTKGDKPKIGKKLADIVSLSILSLTLYAPPTN